MKHDQNSLEQAVRKAGFPENGSVNKHVFLNHNGERFACILAAIPTIKAYSSTGKCVLNVEVEKEVSACP